MVSSLIMGVIGGVGSKPTEGSQTSPFTIRNIVYGIFID